MKNIVTLTTNPAVDMSSITNFVTDEKKLSCKEPLYNPGGGGINVSRAIKILDGESTAIYPSGGDTGRLLESLLDKEKIKQIPIKIKETTRINFSIIEEKTNRQYRFNMPGAKINKKESETIIKELESISPSPDFLVISGSLAPGLAFDYYKKITKICKKIDCRIIIDTSPKAFKKTIEGGVFLIKPNLREFLEITGVKLKSEKQIVNIAKNLIKEKKAANIVISLGAAGSLVVTNDYFEHVHTPLTPIKSRIGAGDSMVAGITLKLAQNCKMIDAVHYGVAAGAAAIMTTGTKLCTKKDTEKLFKIIKN